MMFLVLCFTANALCVLCCVCVCVFVVSGGVAIEVEVSGVGTFCRKHGT